MSNLDAAHISAMIGAGAAIVGVILSSLLLALKEWVVSYRRNAKDSAYLAILAVSHLDRFANDCTGVAHDDGTEEGTPAGRDGKYYQPTTTPPEFLPLDIKVEWKVLPKSLMYEILQIPDMREHLERQLSQTWDYDDPPEYQDFFWARQRGYAELGLHVSSVAKKLRKHAGMPITKTKPGEWSRDVAMQEVIEKIDAERTAFEKRMAATPHAFP